MAYTYKDFATGKIRRTKGKFEGWTDKTGPLAIRYAQFRTACTRIFVPAYCLTQDTLKAIGSTPD